MLLTFRVPIDLIMKNSANSANVAYIADVSH